MKTKFATVYHVSVESDDNICFEDILGFAMKASDPAIIDLGASTRYTLQVHKNSDLYFITLQRLSNNELPYIADAKDGSNERPLQIGNNEALSYKNIFIYNTKNGKLFEVKMNECPRAGRLRLCLQSYYRKHASPKTKIRFGAVINRDLIDLLRGAETITTASIASYDYYGESVKERGFEAYRKYLGGADYVKVTKIKGRKGANIKHVVSDILDGIISGCDLETVFDINMCIDGQKIDFNRYYKQIPIEISEDSRNKKYVDYDDLNTKLATIAKDYTDEE